RRELAGGGQWQGDVQLGPGSEGCVQQAAKLRPDAHGKLVGGAPDQAREGNDGQRRRDEGQQRLMRQLREQRRRDEDEQPVDGRPQPPHPTSHWPSLSGHKSNAGHFGRQKKKTSAMTYSSRPLPAQYHRR